MSNSIVKYPKLIQNFSYLQIQYHKYLYLYLNLVVIKGILQHILVTSACLKLINAKKVS